MCVSPLSNTPYQPAPDKTDVPPLPPPYNENTSPPTPSPSPSFPDVLSLFVLCFAKCSNAAALPAPTAQAALPPPPRSHPVLSHASPTQTPHGQIPLATLPHPSPTPLSHSPAQTVDHPSCILAKISYL
ncbi:MAG: hypothetical protein WHV28_09430 [Bacteroidota bacterium]